MIMLIAAESVSYEFRLFGIADTRRLKSAHLFDFQFHNRIRVERNPFKSVFSSRNEEEDVLIAVK